MSLTFEPLVTTHTAASKQNADYKLVYQYPWNVLLALVAFLAMALFYLWSSRVLVVGPHGVSIFLKAQYVAAVLSLALLFGVVVPLMVRATRLAEGSTSQVDGTALGAIFGTVSMTYCAPVSPPAILSLLGFSGTNILHLNQTANRFWMVLTVASITVLSYSSVSVVQSLNLECELNISPDVVAVECVERVSGSAVEGS